MSHESKIYQYLESSALISDLPDPVKNQVHNLLADSIMSPSVVISRILLTGDHLDTNVNILHSVQ